MKTSMTFKGITLATLLAGALALPVLAQPGPGMGGGWGGGLGMGGGMGMGMGGGPGMWHGGCGAGMGPGSGMGPCGRGMMSNQNSTSGWMLTTPEERTAFQIKMREVKTYDECKVVQADHYKVLESRAKDKGVTLQGPRQNGCDMLKARGLIK